MDPLCELDWPPLSGPCGLLVQNRPRRHGWSQVERTGGQAWRCRRFRDRLAIPQRAVRPGCVFMPPPGFDQDFCLGQGIEDLSVQKLFTLRAVEPFAAAILQCPSGPRHSLPPSWTILKQKLGHAERGRSVAESGLDEDLSAEVVIAGTATLRVVTINLSLRLLFRPSRQHRV